MEKFTFKLSLDWRARKMKKYEFPLDVHLTLDKRLEICGEDNSKERQPAGAANYFSKNKTQKDFKPG